MTETIAEADARYARAMHAVQSGVKTDLSLQRSKGGEKNDIDYYIKHLRVGIDSSMVTHQAVAELLMAKGIFTAEEYHSALADAAEKEWHRYEDYLSELMRTKVTLG